MMTYGRSVVLSVLLLGLLGVLGPLEGARTWAESGAGKDPLVEHLEYLGYQCDQVENGIRAKHFSKIHIFITFSFGGIRLQTGFPGKTMEGSAEARYRVSNALMKHMKVLQVYWSETGNLFAMAWMPGTYDKFRFAAFMEAWEHDTMLLRQAYGELQPFLKDDSGVSSD
jgi:hypothetical protein